MFGRFNDKRNELIELASASRASRYHYATIGDMPNDVLMFRKSGLSIAMGNASPEVQAQADLVTESYEDEGFAKAIERFILPRSSSNSSGVP